MAMEEIIARLGLDSSAAQRGIDQFNNAITSAGQFVSDLGSRIAQAFTAGALLNLAKEAVQYASDINDAAEATRTGVEQYQVLAVAARESGASMQQLDKALIASTLSGERAAEGNKQMSEAFGVLNINVAKFNELPTERKLEAIGAAYIDAGRSQEAYAAITEILGAKAAPRLMSALEDLGRNGFDVVSAKAREAGLVLSELDAKNLDHLADQFQNWKTKGLVFVGELTVAFEQFFKYLSGTSKEQLINEFIDPARASVRMEAIQQLVSDGFVKIREKAVDEFGRILIPEKIVSQVKGVGDAQVLIEQRITEILSQRRSVEAENAAFSAQRVAAAEREAEIANINKTNADALKMLEEGRALLRLKEMDDKDKLVILEEKHAEAVQLVQNMEALGEGTAQQKQEIVKRVLDLEKEIGSTKEKIAKDEETSQNNREKNEEKLLDLIREQAKIAGSLDNRDFEDFGRSPGDLAAVGGGSTLSALAQEQQRVAAEAQRRFDELARRRAAAAEGGRELRPEEQRDIDEAQKRFDESNARLKGLNDKITGAQGGSTGDPLVDKMEENRKEIEKLREKLQIA